MPRVASFPGSPAAKVGESLGMRLCHVHAWQISSSCNIDLLDSSSTIAAKPTRRKRNDLTLKQKYKMIKESEKHRTLTARELAVIYECGKTQEYQILKIRLLSIVI